MEKNLSNWLVASDIDGTLNNKMRQLPKRNYNAIDRFSNTLGGKFTLASGRGIESMRPHYNRLPTKEIPAVIINGAGIYDFNKEELIYFNSVGEQGRDVLISVMKRFPDCEVEIVTPKVNYFVNAYFKARFMLVGDPLEHKFYKKAADVPFENWGKVIFFALPSRLKQIIKYINSLQTDKLSFMSSSVVSYEMLGDGVNKGSAVLALAEMLGIDRKYTAAIGDYFNDYEMLKAVGLSACCGQAPKALKEISSFCACHCNDGAVADLLEHIEKIS